MITGLLIINIIIGINILVFLGFIMKFLSDTHDIKNTKKETNNERKYYDIYSLEFNTLLDDKIRPMLGKYKNEDIVRYLTEELITDVDTDYYDLKDHISGVLLNYNNTYDEYSREDQIFVEELPREATIADSSDHISATLKDMEKNVKEFKDIAITLNSFYND